MLAGATEFPNAGSYGLLLSPAPPGSATAGWGPSTARVEGPQLVRILRTYSQRPSTITALVSLPLRDGAGGTREVPLSDLIDATPLTGAEAKEMVELGRELRQSRLTQRAWKSKRFETLKQRAVYAPMLCRLLKDLDQKQRRAA